MNYFYLLHLADNIYSCRKTSKKSNSFYGHKSGKNSKVVKSSYPRIFTRVSINSRTVFYVLLCLEAKNSFFSRLTLVSQEEPKPEALSFLSDFVKHILMTYIIVCTLKALLTASNPLARVVSHVPHEPLFQGSTAKIIFWVTPAVKVRTLLDPYGRGALPKNGDLVKAKLRILRFKKIYKKRYHQYIIDMPIFVFTFVSPFKRFRGSETELYLNLEITAKL